MDVGGILAGGAVPDVVQRILDLPMALDPCGELSRNVSRPEELSYCPADTTLDEVVRIADSRWAI